MYQIGNSIIYGNYIALPIPLSVDLTYVGAFLLFFSMVACPPSCFPEWNVGGAQCAVAYACTAKQVASLYIHQIHNIYICITNTYICIHIYLYIYIYILILIFYFWLLYVCTCTYMYIYVCTNILVILAWYFTMFFLFPCGGPSWGE